MPSTKPAKRPTREPIVKSTGEPFDVFMKRLLSVPKKEIDRREAAYQRARKKKKRRTARA
jgi:hypothetical protein